MNSSLIKPKTRICERCNTYSAQFVSVRFPRSKTPKKICTDCLGELLLAHPQYVSYIKLSRCVD